jgi:hypothetical protein
MTLEQTLAEHRRLSILLLLNEAGGTANESVLQSSLEQLGLGAGLTREKVRSDLRFLEDAGAVKLEWVMAKLGVATITRHGVEVSQGRNFIEGVKRPSIGI